MGLELRGTVSLDGSGWERGLSRMAGSVKSFVAGAFGFYGVQQAIQKTFETAEHLVDASQRLGIGVEKLQVFEQAAKDAGSSLEAIVKGFEKVEIARARALGGGAESKKSLSAFSQLGVSPAMLETMSREDLFTGPIAKAIQTMNPADVAAPMRVLFERGFGEFVPVLMTDFDELGGRMRKLGAIMSTETAASLDLLKDQFSVLSSVLSAQLGPVLLKVIEALAIFWTGLRGSHEGAGSILGGIIGRGESLPTKIGDAVVGRDTKKWSSVWDTIKETFNPATITEDFQEGFELGAGPMGDAILSYRAQFALLSERLKNPPKATHDVTDDSVVPKVKIHKDSGGDALVRVGNFLGSSRNTLERLTEQSVQYMRQIAENTSRMATSPAASDGLTFE